MIYKTTLLALLLIPFFSFGQNVIYQEEFNGTNSHTNEPPQGYSVSLQEGALTMVGDGSSAAYTFVGYRFQDETGDSQIDISENPKLYIKAKGTNSPELRMDLQDNAGYVTNLNAGTVVLNETYAIYEIDYSTRLQNGGYGGACTAGPCPVDATAITNILFAANAASGNYNGTISIDWVSIGAPLEAPEPPTAQFYIRYNQVSYLKGRKKIIDIVGTQDFDAVPYTITDTSGEEIVSGTTGQAEYWMPSNEYVAAVDITAIDEAGIYTITAKELEVPFTIAEKDWSDLGRATLKYYYYNRASTEITAALGGDYQRAFGHPDDQVMVHASAASATRPEGTIIAAPKGWYDAGDYNKYIVNSGISTYTLLAAYEHYPEYYKNLTLELPEAGGSLPDILDEILWNLDWMLNMQDPTDGGVYHKLTGLNFSGTVMPADYDLKRYVVAKSTAAALDFAAVMATASRIFADFETEKPGYSAMLLEAAQKAYTWSENNPALYFTNPPGVVTGEYGDGNVQDEFQWAAAELFITTGEDTYGNQLDLSAIDPTVPYWGNVNMLGIISLDFHKNLLDENSREAVTTKLTEIAQNLRQTVQNSPMQVAMGSPGDFSWGSNGGAGNQLLLLLRAFESTGDASYLDAAYLGMDYLLGRNGTGYSYISGYGTKFPMHPHHRISEADAVDLPVPGMVAGGPNPGQQDGCSYPSDAPASSFSDSYCSYASNEVTINWNAPVAYVVNALNYYQQNGVNLSVKEVAPQEKKKSFKIYPNPTRDNLKIVPEGSSEKDYKILDSSGKVIKKGTLKQDHVIALEYLNAGLYFVQLGTEKANVLRFIKY
ncbi:glycoside hydrolase family 9 protein [Flavimarina sp. Hel_I_48]|uniref:glycoside hydrolase family 9 protein n=1 Tax=Flavimarina sp. Hel_I_48 TaxID=1392488 RepID=UPI00068E190C|nr:glycoside hydrolase family 9 protein [Flavimarina sp. Hel_I_48]